MASRMNSFRWRGHAFAAQMWDPVISAAFDRVLAFLEKQLKR
jgi:hypothetical protein